MKEHGPAPDIPAAERVARPPYDRIAAGLTRLLAASGVPVREAFLPGKQLVGHDPATGALVFHPWAPTKLRAEALLDHAVRSLLMRDIDPYEDYRDEAGVAAAIGWRPRQVHEVVARHYGLETAEEEAAEPLTGPEQALVERIVGAIEDDQSPAEGARPETKKRRRAGRQEKAGNPA